MKLKRLFALLIVAALAFSMMASLGEGSNTPIRIGVYMPMTGTNAGSGLTELDGIQIAVDELNEAGGINGRMIELISYDDAGTTEGATKAATRLIEDDGVQVILGSFQSPNILAVSDLTEKAKVLHVGTGTGATWTNIGLEYTYRATANGSLPIGTMMEELVDMGMGSFALISVESEYGQSGRSSVLAAAEAAGVDVKADLTYQSADTDFTGIIIKALSAGADTVVLYGLGQEMAMIVKQLRQNGYEDLVFTIEGGANSEMFTVAGESSNGLVFAAAYVVPETPDQAATEMMADKLRAVYEKTGNMPYSDTFYRGYDQMALVGEALKNCEDPDSGESIMNAFRQLSGVELLGGTFDFTDGTGDGLSTTNKYMILDGSIKAYDKEALEAWRK